MLQTSLASRNAISLLVKRSDVSTAMPEATRSNRMFDIFYSLAGFLLIDDALFELYGKVRSFQRKTRVLALYLEAFPDCALRSEWLKRELLHSLEAAESFSKAPRSIQHRSNPLKQMIANLKRTHPGASAFRLCALLDGKGQQTPRSWQSKGDRTWTGAYKTRLLTPRVKTYLSKVEP
jgi:hypothetical protein